MGELISTNALLNCLKQDNIVILDCSWNLSDKNTKTLFNKSHITGSHFFDIEDISNKNSKFPHMLPKLEYFKKKTNYFNIHKDSKIIVYGYDNLMGPARVWWMFKYFGFQNILVLNGGLKKWIKERKKTTSRNSVKKKSSFSFKINSSWLINKNDILKNLNNKKYIIFDARSKNRFIAKEKEFRKGLKSGHIPYSKNIFWKNVTTCGEKFLKKSLINNEYSKYNLKNKNIIFTCGSGISACGIILVFISCFRY